MPSNPASPLLPILRSGQQAQILAVLFTADEREWQMHELAEAAGVTPMTTGREVALLEGAGIVTVRSVGVSKLVSVNPASPYFSPLRELVLIGFGPQPLLADALRDISGVEKAFIFGSWAERRHGLAGRSPNDIDLMVIGSPERGLVHSAVSLVEQQIRMPVQVAFRTLSDWRSDKESFLVTVKSRPLIELDLDKASVSA